MKYKSIFSRIIVAGILAATFTGPAMAETKLVMSSWLPATSPLVVNAIKPWAADVAKATEGRVTVRVLAKPIGAPPAHFDLAVDGIADITYGLHSFTKDDRFIRSRIGKFSYIGDDAATASSAFWDVYNDTLEGQKEHKGVKLLSLFLHGPGMFHTSGKRISTAVDFAGQKIRTPGGYIAELAKGLGSVTVFMGPGEVFEKLSRGVIDGVTFPYEGLKGFRLTGHIKYSMRVPGGLYNTSWFLVMNQDVWDDISNEDKAAIEAISGSAFAKRAGEAWNAADTGGLAAMKEAGIEIYDASAEVLDAVNAIAAPLEAAWFEELSGAGYDGKAALSALRKQASGQ